MATDVQEIRKALQRLGQIAKPGRDDSVPVREYLASVLPGLADVRIQKLAELTPAVEAARRR